MTVFGLVTSGPSSSILPADSVSLKVVPLNRDAPETLRLDDAGASYKCLQRQQSILIAWGEGRSRSRLQSK
jgi:hypothetical protein